MYCIFSIFFLGLLVCCGFDPLTGFESPDGTKIALVYIKRFDNKVTNVSIISKSQSLPKKGNVAIFEGIVHLDIEWKDESEIKLNISDSDKEKIIYLNKQFDNIVITVE